MSAGAAAENRGGRFGALVERRRFGAGERTRTADLLITNQLLYQLSYAGNPLESVPYENPPISASRSCQPNPQRRLAQRALCRLGRACPCPDPTATMPLL